MTYSSTLIDNVSPRRWKPSRRHVYEGGAIPLPMRSQTHGEIMSAFQRSGRAAEMLAKSALADYECDQRSRYLVMMLVLRRFYRLVWVLRADVSLSKNSAESPPSTSANGKVALGGKATLRNDRSHARSRVCARGIAESLSKGRKRATLPPHDTAMM
jgi:hypothetical protein